MRGVPTFVIKGNMSAFVMGDGMGDAPIFTIKGDAPLVTRVSFTYNRRRAIGTCVPLLSEKRTRLVY
jgi:hypothetical protein